VMAQRVVFIAGLLLIAESQASDVAGADQGFLSKYVTAPMQRTPTSIKGKDSLIIDDKPVINQAPQVYLPNSEPVANDSNTPITLSAIGVGLLALMTMLGVHMRTVLRPATSLADNIMELQSQGSTTNAREAEVMHGGASMLAASGFVRPGGVWWDPLDLDLTAGPRPAVFVTDPKGKKEMSFAEMYTDGEYGKAFMFPWDSRTEATDLTAIGHIVPVLATTALLVSARVANGDIVLPSPAVFVTDPKGKKEMSFAEMYTDGEYGKAFMFPWDSRTEATDLTAIGHIVPVLATTALLVSARIANGDIVLPS